MVVPAQIGAARLRKGTSDLDQLILRQFYQLELVRLYNTSTLK